MFAKLLIALISPLGTALVLAVLGLLLAWRGRRRLVPRLGVVALVWLWVWAMPASSLWLRAQMEGEFPPQAVEALPVAQSIVVLGGAMSAPDAQRPLPDLHASADRVWHAARLYHAGKAPLLVLSGGSDPAVSTTSEAEAMRGLLRDLGVPEAAMLVEVRSRNTRENARYSAALLRERGMDEVLLVTSALHMRRALRVFQDEGLRVVPAATDHEAAPAAGWLCFVPDAAALEGSARALKEWTGRWVW